MEPKVISKALEIWSVQTLCDIGILLSLISFLLHIARPYFDRILGRITLRVAADIWWLTYVALRDGALFFSVILGLFCLNLDLMADIKIGLPFVPFATVALAGALLVKVFRNTDDLNRNFRLTLYLVSLGALLNTIGFVLIMEAPGDEYAEVRSAFWQTLRQCRSNASPGLSSITFYVTFALLVIMGGIAAGKAIRLYSRSENPAEKAAGTRREELDVSA